MCLRRYYCVGRQDAQSVCNDLPKFFYTIMSCWIYGDRGNAVWHWRKLGHRPRRRRLPVALHHFG